ncbi:MAG: beta-lactamase family protein [Actinomycetia bacterium]|nr:beta-lactamase family protein [Actinomycetes bacterium]
MRDLLEATRRSLRHRIHTYQADARIPGMYAALTRDARIAYGAGVGSADLERPGEEPTEQTRFQIASITKTFTSVLTLALRDAGKLDLADPIERHIPESRHTGITIRQMLSHATGMQREPVGDVWDTLVPVAHGELVNGWNAAERVLRAGDRFHYSNLVFSMLGEIVARIEGRPWADSLQARILDPLGMRATSLASSDADSRPYYVPPHTDVPVIEPVLDVAALAPAGSLRSNASDLATWLGFLANPTDEVLAPDTVEEMSRPQLISDSDGWQSAWGLGLLLVRHHGRTYVGHPGGMPGQVTCALVDRETGTGAVTLLNAPPTPDPVALTAGLVAYADEHDPAVPEPWRPGTSVPDELVGLLGRWYAEGQPHEFSVRRGALESRQATAPADAPPSVFERIEADLYRTKSGREVGERLRVSRNDDGSVSHLNWATYRLTREPLPFGGWL